MIHGRRAVVLAGVGLALLAAAVFGYYYWRRPVDLNSSQPAADPRLEYSGAFRNVHPSVQYVSDQRCAECHDKIARAFAEHPMGRSLLPISRAALPSLDAAARNPFEALGSHFSVQREGDAFRQRRVRLGPDGKPAAEQTWDVHFVVGSGRRGYSYLSEVDGCLLQTPVSWYAQKSIWDLSPGFRQPLLTGRGVLPECLFCHSNRAHHLEGTTNRYAQPVFEGHAIGCQRCHGPGALHVAERDRLQPLPDKSDYSIVNPGRLEPFLREGVCEQCHLVGEDMVARRGRDLYDFRPGLRPEQFWSVLGRAAEPNETPKAVSHVEQMYQSICYERGTESERLGCISCHDPHRIVPAADRISYYRKRCQTCHQQKGCTEVAERRHAKQDSCIDCHMPRYGSADVPHTASTDHRILRTGKPTAPPKPLLGTTPGISLVSLYRGLKGVDDDEDERARAIALVKRALGDDPLPPHVLRQALSTLEAALQRDPADWAAAEARGYALMLQSRYVDALTVFKDILMKAPNRERSLVGAASMAAALDQPEPALAHWRRAIAVNPVSPDYRRNLATLLVKREAWPEGLTESEAWIRLDPFSADARTARITCLLALDRKADARAEFARVEALTPSNLGELKIRFEKKLR